MKEEKKDKDSDNALKDIEELEIESKELAKIIGKIIVSTK